MCCCTGPPGLGKTTLAQIVAREMGVGFRATSGPVIQRAGDLAALLTNLQPRDVLFIDEIHRLTPAVEEILYPAMEDFQLDLMIGEGPAARSVRIDLPPFTLVGATTRSGLMTRRCASASAFRCAWSSTSRRARADRDRAAPRAGDGAEPGRRRRDRARARAARRASPAACCAACATSRRSAGHRRIDAKVADAALTRLEVDERGLDAMDRRYLACIAENYGGGPVGVETLAAALVRAARRDRGRDRALSDAAGPAAAHAARPDADRTRLSPSRAGAAARRAAAQLDLLRPLRRRTTP